MAYASPGIPLREWHSGRNIRVFVFKMLQKAKRRVDGLMNQGIGLPAPAPTPHRAHVGEFVSDALGAVWSACWRRGR